MPDLHITREHALGMARAREVAQQWMTDATEQFGMDCRYEQGETLDRITFARTGVSGELRVSGEVFELEARLGFLLGTFSDRIEREIRQNLDTLLAG